MPDPKNSVPSGFDDDLDSPIPEGFDADLPDSSQGGLNAPISPANAQAATPLASPQMSPQNAVQGQPAMSPIEEYFRAARGPITLGYGDELSAYLASKISGSPYEKVLERERALDSAAVSKHPLVAGAAEVAGGIGATVAGGVPGAVAYGALRGSGEGQSDADRLKMGLVGGALGGAIPAIGSVGKGAIGAVSKSARAVRGLLSEGDEVLNAASNIAKKASSDIFSFFSPKNAARAKDVMSVAKPSNIKARALEANNLLRAADDPWGAGASDFMNRVANQSQATKVSRLVNANPEARTAAEKVLRKAIASPNDAAVEHTKQMAKSADYRVAFRKAVDEGVPSTDAVPRGEWTRQVQKPIEDTISYVKAPKLSR